MRKAQEARPNRCSGEAYLTAQRLLAELFEGLEERNEVQDSFQATFGV